MLGERQRARNPAFRDRSSDGQVSPRQGRAVPIARPLRILCSRKWFEGRTVGGSPIESTMIPSGGLVTTLRLFMLARQSDAVVIEEDERRLLMLCFLKRLIGTRRCRVVSVGANLTPARTWRDRLHTRVAGWLLREVDLFICYFKATERLRSAYSLEQQAFAYVPFKVNGYATVRAATPVDGGFGLVCGRSDRDYRTLAAAADGLDVRIVVLTGPDHATLGVDVDHAVMPANVTVQRDDGSFDTWVDWIARSRFVILPVLPDVIKPSGVSTYLVAMALGKCVIMTDSPATQGLIDSGQAVVVPQSDALALREAIAQVASDATYRETVAARGKAYAYALGDDARFADDIVNRVGTLIDPAAYSRPSTA